MKDLSSSMSVKDTSVFKDPNVAKTLCTIYNKYVVAPADVDDNITL